MSNTTEMPNALAEMAEETEKSYIKSDPSFDLTDDQLKAAQVEVKQVQTTPALKVKPKLQTAAQFVAEAQAADKKLASNAGNQQFDPNAVAQVMTRGKAPIKVDAVLDYSKLTQEDIYRDDIPLEAKPFGSDDSLNIKLKDPEYHARWVNKDPRMLGTALRNGFTYITEQDLAENLQVEITQDVNGRFLNGDVYAMKILKSRYYPALRAAHLRAVNTVSSLSSKKAAQKQAADFLNKQTAGHFSEEYEAGKIEFYTPGIEI